MSCVLALAMAASAATRAIHIAARSQLYAQPGAWRCAALPPSAVAMSITDGEGLAAVASNLTATQRLMRKLPNLPAKLVSAAIVAAWAGAGIAILPEALGTTVLAVGVSGFGGVGTKFAREVRATRSLAPAGR